MLTLYPCHFAPFICFVLAALASTAAISVQAALPPGYQLIWSDEFGVNNSQPSSSKWTYDLGAGGWGNAELQTYVNDYAHVHVVPDSGATDGHALRIQATWSAASGYRSVRMKTAGIFAPKFGFIEARLKLPSGQGIWPAFWMLGSNIGSVGWPACGEIDIMENIGNNAWLGTIQSTLHGPNYSGANGLAGKYSINGAFRDGYHLFQVLWKQDSIQFYVDGNLYHTRTRSSVGSNPWPFNAPMFLILNLAVGGNWPGYPDSTTTFPQNYMIDYVRVYQPVVAPGPVTMEAERLNRTSSGAATTAPADSAASGGATVYLNADGAGDSITFTTPSIPAGTYQLKLRYKQYISRGTMTVHLDGMQLGAARDQYSTTASYVEYTIGTRTFTTTGTHTIRLTVTGRNAASTAYTLSADRFILTP